MKHFTALLSLCILMFILFSCSAKSNFRFTLPDTASFKDIPVQYLTAPDTAKLAYREIGKPTGNIAFIFIPGSTMYGYYYIPMITELAKYNIFVRIIDIRGHGDSDGTRGDVPNENTLIDDLALHIHDLKLKNPGINIVIGGHSMGGGICGRYLEHYGYDSVKGVVYIAPLFHYMQPGMKNPGYVDVSIIKFLFGGNHTMYQFYHPSSDDPKLVREYSNIMAEASMVKDFPKFRKNHSTNAVYIIGKEDELFEWNKSLQIFENKNVKYIVLEKTGHLNYKFDSLKELGLLINNL